MGGGTRGHLPYPPCPICERLFHDDLDGAGNLVLVGNAHTGLPALTPVTVSTFFTILAVATCSFADLATNGGVPLLTVTVAEAPCATWTLAMLSRRSFLSLSSLLQDENATKPRLQAANTHVRKILFCFISLFFRIVDDKNA